MTIDGEDYPDEADVLAVRAEGQPRHKHTLDVDARALAGTPEMVRFAKRLAAKASMKFGGSAEVLDDFESAALLGLSEAAATFDPKLGLRFSTLADKRVRGAILDAMREAMPAGYRARGRKADRATMPRIVPVWFSDSPLNGEADSDCMQLTPCDRGPGPSDQLEEEDHLRWLTRGLDPQASDAVRAYYGPGGLTMKQIARSMGLSEARVSQIVTHALAFLRDRAEHEEAMARRRGEGTQRRTA